MRKPVGVLALQGDFAKHEAAFKSLGQETLKVRRPADLALVDSLVIPGGESTTLTRLVDRVGLRGPIQKFATTRPVMGTCAGLIMMATETEAEKKSDYGVEPLGLMDCTVVRNGYGRQIDSFIAEVSVDRLDVSSVKFPAVFIRAPRITRTGPAVEILVEHQDEPVLVRQGHLFGMTFHPELTDDSRIHQVFLGIAKDIHGA